MSACRPRVGAVEPLPVPPRIAIVVSEGDARGARLVAIDEHGDRQLELVQASATLARDTNPAVSPDGAWLVFASSRGRPLAETSLWIARLAPAAVPVPLTTGPAIDAHPVWSADGAALIWASTRGGHGFDLWRAPVALGGPRPALGTAEALTSGAGHEVTPTIAPGGVIAYAAVEDHGDGTIASHLEERAADGTIRALTTGTTDSAPAISPDGARLVFARPVARTPGTGARTAPPVGGARTAPPVAVDRTAPPVGGAAGVGEAVTVDRTAPPVGGAAGVGEAVTVDSELWIVGRAGGEPSVLVDLPLTDESGPVWSRDGRYVFATSLLRGADGRAVFSSVIVIDTREPRPVARLLEDRVGPIARLTPALATAALDDAALHDDPEYLPELARIMAQPIIESRQRERPAP